MTLGAWEWTHIALGGVASAVFLFQALGSAETDSGAEAGVGGAGGDAASTSPVGGISDYLSVQNFVAFFVGYGWVTLACLAADFSRPASSLLGAASGVSFAVVSLFLIRSFLKFQEDGSIRLEALAGVTASVYIAIGASASSAGKVMVDTQKGRIELTARTKDPETLRPGQLVRIQEAEAGILWVTKEM